MILIKNITFLNEIGRRVQLEDAIYPQPGKAVETDRLFLVCDGVGGENMGEEASRIACEMFPLFVQQSPPTKDQLTKEYINKAQQFVLRAMHDYAHTHPDNASKMSTTLTLAYIGKKSITVAWCGDSRIYHIRDGAVLWQSTDHSVVANLLKYGEITAEEALIHPQRNIITRSLSGSDDAPSTIDVHYLNDLRDGDYIMLCTDGVLEQINEERLKEILLSGQQDKESLLMAYAEEKTRDNFSLYLLELTTGKPIAGKKNNRFLIPLLLLLAAVLLALAFNSYTQHWVNTIIGPPAVDKQKVNKKAATYSQPATPLPQQANDSNYSESDSICPNKNRLPIKEKRHRIP